MPTLPKGRSRSWIPKAKPQNRQIDNSQFYHSKAWRMTRKFYIKANPLCEQCTRDGRTTGGQMVDHIRQITMGGDRLHQSNLQTLCNSCHAKKSASEAVEYRRGIKDYERQK
jgi:5-methylcytosine-specific restriction endonuclease McrA|tara:strand:- start:99 stop:434 length:336 start_codon:yes stop_codon:yes gene_type:complete